MAFMARSRSAEAPKPTSGLNSRAWTIFVACDQSTPEVACPAGAISWLARPTPMIEPMRAWEEEFGMPSHQVPRFHTIAASRREKIIA